MDDFLCKSDLRRALKSSRGSRRSSAADVATAATAPDRRTQRSRPARQKLGYGLVELATSLRLGKFRLGRERLGIGTLHASAQVLQRAELQLLYCAPVRPRACAISRILFSSAKRMAITRR